MKRIVAIFIFFVVMMTHACAEVVSIHWSEFISMDDWLVVTEENKWMYEKEIQIAFDNSYVDAIIYYEDANLGYWEVKVDLQIIPNSDFSFDEIETDDLFDMLVSTYAEWPEGVFDLSKAKMQTIGNNKWYVMPGTGEFKNTIEYQTCYKGQMTIVTATFQYYAAIELLTHYTEFFLKYYDYKNH